MKTIDKIKSNMSVPVLSELQAFKQRLAIGTAIIGAMVIMSHSSISSAAVSITIGGEVERIIVDDPLDTWSSGIMVVAGSNVIIPRNMVIDLPANRLTLQQFFVNAPAACAAIDDNGDGIPDQTGLAKADSCNGSFTGAAVTMLANKTNAGDIIAGEIMLEKATELVSGIVSFINYDGGYFRVDGNMNLVADDGTGAMVRVNDPEGRFTHQVGAGCPPGPGPHPDNCSADTRYGVDPDNYTFTASTGYPMCIPSTVERGPYDFDVNHDFTIVPAETGLTAQAATDGTGDALCPEINRGTDPVGDSRLFAPILVGDHVNAEGNFETIDGVTFLSAHTVGVSVGLTTDDTNFQPDYVIFDEVGWDAPGFQNARVRDLLIAFGTLGTTHLDIFGLYYDPANNAVEELVIATTFGCDLASGGPNCTNQGIVGNSSVFKIVHDVDFDVVNNGLPNARQSPCQHLNAAYGDPAGIPAADGTIMNADIKGRCTGTITLAKEFEVLSPPTRDLIGRTRHKHDLDPSVVTLDFHGVPSQNGEYLNPVGIGHPEFVEIDLNGLQTPLIFAGEPWNSDRRLGPGGGCDGETSCDPGGVDDVSDVPIGDASMALDPFPFSDLDPGTQVVPGVPTVTPLHATPRGRTLSYWPLEGEELPWPPTDPVAQGISPTLHAGLMCLVLSGIDSDGDGVDDAIDNCTNHENGTLLPVGESAISQRDTDGDGYGNVCDADLNGDLQVNLSDFSLFRSAFGTPGPDADFNGDGQVNLSDFSLFRSMFGSPPGPSGLNP